MQAEAVKVMELVNVALTTARQQQMDLALSGRLFKATAGAMDKILSVYSIRTVVPFIGAYSADNELQAVDTALHDLSDKTKQEIDDLFYADYDTQLPATGESNVSLWCTTQCLSIFHCDRDADK